MSSTVAPPKPINVRVLLMIAILVFGTVAPVRASDITGFARVIDGDTIFIGDVEIELHGIDALETNQHCRRDREFWPCGQEATERLWTLIGDGHVMCTKIGQDQSGRVIGRCLVEGKDINAAMVDAGLAMANRRFSQDYVSNEMAARQRRAGMFSGSYKPPWVWRRH